MGLELRQRDEREDLIRPHGRNGPMSSLSAVLPAGCRAIGDTPHMGDAPSVSANNRNGGGFPLPSKSLEMLHGDGMLVRPLTATAEYTMGGISDRTALCSEKDTAEHMHGLTKTCTPRDASNAAAVAISLGCDAKKSSGGQSVLNLDSRAASSKLKLFTALLYAVMSLAIMMLTKTIFTMFDFRCFIFLGFLQYITTAVITLMRVWRGTVSFPLRNAFRILSVDLFPLPLVFVVNTLTGLGATESLNMPLFVLLRHLSIAMTLFGESVFLHYRHGASTQFSVFLMLVGAFVATGFGTHTIPIGGVILVLVNDACTALNGVLTRWRLDEGRLSSEGVMFYTNAFAAAVSGMLLFSNVGDELDELWQLTTWSPSLVLLLTLNALSGYGISYCTYLCIKLNSPLTVSMIGAGKNVISSYAGMIFRDYTFAFPSFVGINISVLGFLLYSHGEIRRIMEGAGERCTTTDPQGKELIFITPKQ